MLGFYETKGAFVVRTVRSSGILNSLASFKNMSEREWDQVIEVHLKGAYSCTKAAWPIFRKQKFGRILNTASAAGLFGNSHCDTGNIRISHVDVPSCR